MVKKASTLQQTTVPIKASYILDRIPGMVVLYNIQTGIYTFVNSSVRKVLGYSAQDIISGGFPFVSSLVHPDDLPAIMAENEKALAEANKKTTDGSPIVTFEYRIKHKNGKYRWLHTDGMVYDRDAQGNVLHIMNISIDITERRELEIKEAHARKVFEQKLLQSERRYRSLIENSYEAVAITDKNGTFTYASPSIKKVLGYTSSEIIGKRARELFPPDYRKEELKKFKEVTTPGKTIKVVSRCLHKNGKMLWIDSTVSNFLNDPFVKGYVANFRDITKEKLAEEKQQHMAAIVASSDDAIISKTLDGTITSWNNAAHKIYGYSAKEALGKNISIIIPPEQQKEEERIISILKQGKHIDHFETTRRTKSGEKILISLSVSPIKDEKGTIIGASKIARDITKQKQIEKEAKRNEERLQLAIDAGKIGIWDWDITNNNIVWSDRVYEIHEVPKGTKIGELEKYRRHHHPDDAERVKEAIEQALAGTKPYQEEFRILTPSGKTKWIETKAVVIRDQEGKPLRMLGATLDITHRKNLEQQKDEFIGIASHELKTPVTSIKAYTQLLESKFSNDGNEKATTMLRKVNTQLNKLTVLISDLLDVTKIETGKLEFYEATFDFNELITEIVEELQPTTKKHKLITKLDKTARVFGDRDRIGQVLTNFLTNAIKYSPQADEVHITSKRDKHRISVSVRDFGIGIPTESKNRVFERFYRVSTQASQTFPGMGLGLYISSQIIERQHGTIWVESKKGKGSTFSFSLPLKQKK